MLSYYVAIGLMMSVAADPGSTERPTTASHGGERQAGAALVEAIAAPARDEPPAATARASNDPGSSELDRLRDLVDAMKTLSANFRQTTENSAGYIDEILTGTIQVAVPGRLRWEVEAPYPQLVLADGERLWVYDPDLLQVSVRPIESVNEAQQSLFIAGTDRFLADHRITALDATTYRLEPRSADSIFRDLVLRFEAERLAEMIISDHLDSLTTIRFTDVRTAIELDDAIFAFEIPPDVDVVGDVAPAAVP